MSYLLNRKENIMTQFELRTIDLPTFARHTIGFDRLFNEMGRTFANSRNDNYPPYNIAQLDDTHYVIEVAVAGFEEDELDIELKDQVLLVKGSKVKKDTLEITYAHKGISTRNFERVFTLNPDVQVRAATVKNGILAVALELVIPEEQKAKKIAITYTK
jgi:molecular chaperone IbpA